MNDQERITQLEAMLTEERGTISSFIAVIENYARGLEMMARVLYGESMAGSRDEENARAIKQHSSNLSIELGVRAAELRGMMGRTMPSGEADMTEGEMTAMFESMFPFGLAGNEPQEAPEPSSPVEAAELPAGATIH